MQIIPILRGHARRTFFVLASLSASALQCLGNLTFETKRLTETFYSEGAGVGDFNKDGKPDVVSGPYWYAGPEFGERHEIYKPEPFPTKAYSKNFLCEAYDIDDDGWDDVLVLGFPGEDAYWFQNPGDTGERVEALFRSQTSGQRISLLY